MKALGEILAFVLFMVAILFLWVLDLDEYRACREGYDRGICLESQVLSVDPGDLR